MEKNKILTVSLLCLVLLSSAALAAPRKFLVFFTDKNNSSFSVTQPQAFLSAKAITRRTKQNIAITTRDLPVNASYVNQIKATGARVWYTSKWFNAAIVETDSNVLATINALPFVVKSQRITQRIVKPSENPLPERNLCAIKTEDYGNSLNQIKMLGADTMHMLGFRGEGMTVAILDAGFLGINGHIAYSHLFDNQQIKGTYDFVTGDSSVYEDNWHGAGVLSCMAAYAPGHAIGTAFKANYYLFRTENASSEKEIECANWAIAAEKADSLGVDVLNTSLGYTTFDDESMNYSYAQLDGNTTLITRAADYAAATGMLVVNSAGNEGNSIAWGGYMSAPADGDSVFSIGAVTSAGSYASFSSRGPTVDGRIKPDVMAQGSGVVMAAAGTADQYTTSSGTSFSGPLVTGLATAFWQAHPELSNIQVMQALRNSGTISTSPNNQLGYGIPSFMRAHRLLTSLEKHITEQGISISPTLYDNQPITVRANPENIGQKVNIRLINADGKLITEEEIMLANLENKLSVNVAILAKGMYMVQVKLRGKSQTFKILKN